MRKVLIYSIGLAVLALSGVGCKDSKRKSSPHSPPVIGELDNKPGEQEAATELLAKQVQRIFEENCISCHQGPNPAANLDLTNESMIVARAADIVEFILNDRLPESEGLTSEELDLIRAWEAAGYPRPKTAKPPVKDPNQGDNDSGSGKGDPNQNNPGQNDPGQSEPEKGKDGDKDADKGESKKKRKCWSRR